MEHTNEVHFLCQLATPRHGVQLTHPITLRRARLVSLSSEHQL